MRHGQFLLDTFGSEPWLRDTPDELRFDRASLELVGAEFQIAGEAADAEDSTRLPPHPARPGGLRADETRDFRLEVTTELCRAPGDTVPTCLRDLDVLDEPLDAPPPSPATRRPLTERLDLAGTPAALTRLRTTAESLRTQQDPQPSKKPPPPRVSAGQRGSEKVEPRRVELLTSAMQRRRSTN